MEISSALTPKTKYLVEGSMYDRLRRLAGDEFDPDLGHLGLLYSERGLMALETAYTEYISASRQCSLPVIIFTPTWKANQENTLRSRYRDRDVNRDAVNFVLSLRAKLSLDPGILVGGLVGCKNDCYSPDLALSSKESQSFHSGQVSTLASSKVDLLFASTLPAVSEGIGIAQAMEKTDKPFMLSFVADKKGQTLCGVPLPSAFSEIDSQLDRKPVGYFVNCVHPEVLLSGLVSLGKEAASLRGRLVGFQGNTSRADPREFDSLQALETQEPEEFATATIELRNRFGVYMLGGCCGTGPGHIEAIGKRLNAEDE